MSIIYDYLKTNKLVDSIISEVKKDKFNFNIDKGNKLSLSLLTILLSHHLSNNIVIITPNLYNAQRIYDTLSKSIDNCLFYPKDDFISMELLTESIDFRLERVNTLNEIFNSLSKKVIITNLTSILSKSVSKETYKSSIIKLNKGDNYKPSLLVKKLIKLGYKRNYIVEKQGDFSLKGSILDIYPINSNRAYRLDYFGDDIEEIRIINTESQKSIGSVDYITILPYNDIIFNDDEIDIIKTYINNKLESPLDEKTKDKLISDKESLDNYEYNRLEKYLSVINRETNSFIDYIDDKIVIYYDFLSITNQEANINNQVYDFISQYNGYFKSNEILNNLADYYFDKTIYVNENSFNESNKSFELIALEALDFKSNLELFKTTIKESKDTLIISTNEDTIDVIKELVKDTKVKMYVNPKLIHENAVNIINEYLPSMEIPSLKLVIYNNESIFKKFKENNKTKYQLRSETKRLKSISELHFGDYVVHYQYGIGQFNEITEMTVSGKTSDFIHIKYSGTGSIYVPVENISVLSKYAGSESNVPKLSTLGTKEWEKTKESAKNKISDLADRLFKLYSDRETKEGFRYLEDSELMKEFENDFKYELTSDQEKAINDTKRDMESSYPMDRLICGDVGFGKTEVALRAAFKAVLSGKQVAYLAPTTILSRQHFYTFKERMDKYGVSIALVNRFIPNKVIKLYLEELRTGKIDIIIGTHRLLSSDVIFRDLGLLIIDEEQRFGVEAKEKIKEYKDNVDCLTLTATPIPRTLEMAITGIKNISLIETAPKNRYPVQTYVLERNDYIIKDAIERELSKNGQVFYLYNRVEDMDKIVSYVSSLVPDAKIASINGQMDKFEIEDVIDDFINAKIDVLISTTIIETGVDIPNANTLIIHDAERYGLSQLYQIKGRVGRSDKISYAYLMYDKRKTLTEDAVKRLTAIKEFTELGSGFKIAVRDLTNRGAGEILGKEQSGFMDRIGVELYLKMLKEELDKKRNKETVVNENSKPITIQMSKYIDKDYISDDYVLIEMHKRISTLSSTNELKDLFIELEDRFGPVRNNLLEYMYTKLCENLINKIGFERADFNPHSVILIFSEQDSEKLDGGSVFKIASSISKNFTFYYKVKRIHIMYSSNVELFLIYKDIVEFIEKVIESNILNRETM